MTKYEQIENIARESCHLSSKFKTCEECNETYKADDELCYYQCIAKKIITLGYRKVERGEWINAGVFEDMAKCSVCGLIEHSLNEVYARGTYKYCPNCGADMRGGDNEQHPKISEEA